MNKLIFIAFFMLLISNTASSKEDLYSKLASIPMLADGYVTVRMPSGMDFKLEKTFTNSKGVVEPVIHLELEGPFPSKFKDLPSAAFYLANVIKFEVDPEFKNEHELYPGLGFDIVDVNGTNVCFMSYKMKEEPDTYLVRAVIFTKKGTYSFAVSMHQATEKNDGKIILSKFVIASVNSGLL